MVRITNTLLLVLLYVAALVVAPAVHRLHGHGGQACAACACGAHGGEESGHAHSSGHSHPKPHDPAQCAICRLAHTPLLAVAPLVIRVPDSAPVRIPAAVYQAPAVPAPRRLPFSCGPPA